jgi:secretory phospholipase A2
LQQNDDFIPEIGYCESGALNITKHVVSNELRNCCIEHDICYQTCDSDRIECDKNLNLCVQLFCETAGSKVQIEICEPYQKHQLSSHNIEFKRCQQFVKSQLEACLCIADKR